MRKLCLKQALAAVSAGALAATSLNVHAVDGVVLIDQNRALAGGVTPADTPGFPVVISRPGSYRLASNLVVDNLATRAIVVSAADVTIDLNGFQISGPGNCDVGGGGDCFNNYGGHGIFASGLTTIRNGSIARMGGHGILCGGTCRIESVTVQSNNGDGINASSGLLIGNFAIANAGVGLRMSSSVGYQNNICSGNGVAPAVGGVVFGANACASP